MNNSCDSLYSVLLGKENASFLPPDGDAIALIQASSPSSFSSARTRTIQGLQTLPAQRHPEPNLQFSAHIRRMRSSAHGMPPQGGGASERDRDGWVVSAANDVESEDSLPRPRICIEGRLPSPPQPQFQNHSKYGNNFRSRRIPPAALSRRCPVAAPSSGSPTRLLPHSTHAGAVLNALPIREFSSVRVLVVASACVWGLHTAFLNGRVSAHVDYALLKTHARLLFALVSFPPLDPGAIQILTAHPPPLLLQFGASPFASTSSARRVRLPLDVHRAPCKPANMFSKLSVVVASAFITLAAAIPQSTPGVPPPPVTPPTLFMCCASVVGSTSPSATAIAGLLGVDISGLNVPIGLSCSPIIDITGCGGFVVICDAPPAEWGGLMAINCLPITF
ncbi:hypothetical protein B0H16DRAFT_1739813 [Mycena metata]|uniref:Hydrophobin n=1 Tax=Mycena metata TaxID=1033252 RepID=A0AAD7MIC9_9AGAR|nr:hypothetical protein B0H16DRAFT_1739813 [Mycena metata]